MAARWETRSLLYKNRDLKFQSSITLPVIFNKGIHVAESKEYLGCTQVETILPQSSPPSLFSRSVLSEASTPCLTAL